MGTTYIGLIYHGDMSYALVGYSNSNYAIDLDAKRYVIGYAFTIGNSLFSWKATLQPIVTLSTIEAEYMALAEATNKGSS